MRVNNGLRNAVGRRTLTVEAVLSRLEFDPSTGVFRWRVKRGSRGAGQCAGTLNDAGYLIIYIDGHGYRAHKLVWLLCHGEWPIFEIDHKDLDKSNNRLGNLRPATHSQNGMNREKSPSMYSDHKGVSFDLSREKWVAQIGVGKKNIYLGRYSSEEGAANAYRSASVRFHGEFSRF